MKRTERLETIVTCIAGGEAADVMALSAALGVSAVTIRKDLQALEQQGRIARSYGKVFLPEGAADRAPATPDEACAEARIASLAAALVDDEDLIFIGPGNTCLGFARQLARHKRLSIITMNVSAAMALSDLPETRLLLLPGDFTRRNGTYYVTGAATAAYAQHLYADKLFITADGIDPGRGFSVLDEVTAQIYHALIRSGTRVYAFVTANRFSRNARAPLGPLELAEAVITDARPGDDYLAAFESHGVRVIYPEQTT